MQYPKYVYALLLTAASAAAQMDMPMETPMKMDNMNDAGMSLMPLASGTSQNPDAWRMPMIMHPFGSWQTMFMGQIFVNDTQQSGSRGGDKFFAPNWMMANAQHKLGEQGAFQFNLMLSLDPATITQRRYPLLFQTGETAFDKPIVDGQHPHDLIMALGFQYARKLGENTTLHLYFAPVGDPALGPVAFPHRASAAELPQATLAHHWQDSTHIANEVITGGIEYKKMKLEVSGFYGAEPNENRWNIDSGPIDSWSTRLWFFPSKQWAAQVSVGRLHNPERFTNNDQVRSTASLAYTRGDWSSTLIWGRNHNTESQHNTNSYVLETVLPISKRNILTARAELVDKDELFGPVSPNYRIGAYTVGYTRDFPLFPHIQSGIGANIEVYTLPDAIKPIYGNRPLGGNIFLRFRLRPKES